MEGLTLFELLSAVKSAQIPVGANYLSTQMGIPPATIGRLMRSAEEEGYLVSVSNKGRCITEKGRMYLDEVNSVKAKHVAAEQLIGYTTQSRASNMKEILEVRRLLEPYAARLACEHMTDADIYELESRILARDMDLRQGKPGAEPDLHLHLLIAKCCGNMAIYHMLTLLLTENNSYILFSNMTNKLNFSELTKHDKILDAIMRRDAEGAYQAMQAHIDKLLQCVESYGG